jgi:hypothetical protein
MASNVSLSSILLIIQTALGALAAIPAVGPEAGLAIPFIQILQAGLSAYHAAAGVPLDVTKIPLETPVA